MNRTKSNVANKCRETACSVLSNATGISTEKIKKIAQEVLNNNILLNNCPFHEFEETDSFNKFICKNCGGIVDAVKKQWYEKGIEHSKN